MAQINRLLTRAITHIVNAQTAPHPTLKQMQKEQDALRFLDSLQPSTRVKVLAQIDQQVDTQVKQLYY